MKHAKLIFWSKLAQTRLWRLFPFTKKKKHEAKEGDAWVADGQKISGGIKKGFDIISSGEKIGSIVLVCWFLKDDSLQQR